MRCGQLHVTSTLSRYGPRTPSVYDRWVDPWFSLDVFFKRTLNPCREANHDPSGEYLATATTLSPLPLQLWHKIKTQRHWNSVAVRNKLLSFETLLYTSGKYLQERDSDIIIKLYLLLQSPYIFFRRATAPSGPWPLYVWYVTITLRHTTPVVLLWTSDQPVAETSTWQQTTLTKDRHPCPRWDLNP
jgi:hypothetical protein